MKTLKELQAYSCVFFLIHQKYIDIYGYVVEADIVEPFAAG